jgi:glucosamine--fructose-6-phosphate aminotransferase (isomerizing)
MREACLPRLRGAFALAFLFQGEEDLLIGARKGSPLAVGYGEGEMYLGSDAIALAPFTNEIAYLEEGDWVVLTARARDSTTIRQGRRTPRPARPAGAFMVDKGNHRHFMAKEIHEQPEVVGHTLPLRRHASNTVRCLLRCRSTSRTVRPRFPPAARPIMPASSAKYWFERSRACRSRSMSPPNSAIAKRRCPGGLALFISQSGETADTLACAALCQGAGQQIAVRRQRPTSTIARESDAVARRWPAPRSASPRPRPSPAS